MRHLVLFLCQVLHWVRVMLICYTHTHTHICIAAIGIDGKLDPCPYLDWPSHWISPGLGFQTHPHCLRTIAYKKKKKLKPVLRYRLWLFDWNVVITMQNVAYAMPPCFLWAYRYTESDIRRISAYKWLAVKYLMRRTQLMWRSFKCVHENPTFRWKVKMSEVQNVIVVLYNCVCLKRED